MSVVTNRLQALVTFDYVPGQRKRRPARWGIIALIITAIVVILGVSHWSPFSSYSMPVNANFANALHIYPDTPVRVNGYDVGTVSGSQLMGDQNVHVQMTLTDSDLKLYANASAELYYRTLLGRNVYIQIDPGSPSAGALPANTTIPVRRTSSQVEVDQVLSTLQPQARSGVQRTVQELGKGLDAGAAPRQSLQRAGSALVNTGGAITAVRGRNPGYDLPRLITGADTAVRALNADESALAGVVDNGNTSLAVTAARYSDDNSTLEQAPGTLAITQQEMVRLRATENVLDPLARNLEPGVNQIKATVQQVTPTLNEITRIVPVAIPTLRRLQPALVSLGQLGRNGVPLIDQLNPTLNRTNASIIPWLSQKSSVTGLENGESIGPTFATVSSSSSTFDGGGFQQRFQPGLKTGVTQSPIPASQCSTILAGISGADQACQNLIGDFNQILGGSAATPAGAKR